MFTLFMKWQAQRTLAPDDIQFILTPREALEMASIFCELNYLEYGYQRNPLCCKKVYEELSALCGLKPLRRSM